jgi:hypothetical protein
MDSETLDIFLEQIDGDLIAVRDDMIFAYNGSLTINVFNRHTLENFDCWTLCDQLDNAGIGYAFSNEVDSYIERQRQEDD